MDKHREWKTMIVVSHDFFHQWRNAVKEKYGKEEADELTLRFWELVGENTADSYVNKGNVDPNDLMQIVQGVARSSDIMGEKCEIKEDKDDVLLIHTECPWIKTYEINGSPGECQQGCDQWFKTTVRKINENFVVETETCLASGEEACVRRFSRKK